MLDSKLTESIILSRIEKINTNRGVIDKGSRIIAKGEVVEGNKFQILNSYKAVFQSQVWSKSNYNWLLFLDADVFPGNKFFIKTYSASILP